MDVPAIAALATELSNTDISNNYQVKLFKGANEQLEEVAVKLIQDCLQPIPEPGKGQLIDIQA